LQPKEEAAYRWCFLKLIGRTLKAPRVRVRASASTDGLIADDHGFKIDPVPIRRKKKAPPEPGPQPAPLPGRNPPPARTPVEELAESDPLFEETEFLATEFDAPASDRTRPGENPPPMIEA
jgi:hypothetical protein